jgi:predicted flap endonuclease-1-like 5' DNA nuclease
VSPFLTGLLLVLAGVAALFWGYRIFRILLPIIGGVAGYLIGLALFPASPFLALGIGFVLAIVLGILAYVAWSAVVTISGAILGASLGAAIAEGLNLWTWLGWLLIVALAILGGILVWKLRDEVVIILTALVGAAFVADGLRHWFGPGTIRGPVWTIIGIVLAAIGIVWQWQRYRHLGLLAFGGPAKKPGAQPLAEPAPTRAAPAVGTGAPAAGGVAPAAVVGAAAVTAGVVAAKKEPPAAETGAPGAGGVAPAAVVGAAAVAAGAAAAKEETPAVEAEAGAPGAAVVGAAAVAAGAVAAGKEPAVVEAEAPAAEAAVAATLKQLETTLNPADLANLRQKVDFIEGVGATYGATLNQVGIVSVMDLLQRGATRKGRAELVAATGIPAGLILKWVNHADLFRITGVGKQFGELLENAGVDTVVELAQRNPVNLFTRMAQVNAEKKLAGRAPRQDEVSKWVEQAKGLPRVVQY